MHTLEQNRSSIQDLAASKPNRISPIHLWQNFALNILVHQSATDASSTPRQHELSSIWNSWTGKICIKERDEVFPARGTANEPARLKLDHLCLSDAKIKYAWICTPTPPCDWVACTGSALPSFCICWATGNVCLFFCEYFPRWSVPVICCDCEVVWQDVRTLLVFLQIKS